MDNQYLLNELLNDSDGNGWYVQLKGQRGAFLLSPVCNGDGIVEAEAKILHHEVEAIG